MKRAFITVRFDRMKNHDLAILCKDIIRALKNVDTEKLQLNVSFERFEQTKPLLKNLEPKYRKLPQTKDMEALRKRQEQLVTAMLLHLKAIERASFEDQQHDLKHCKYLLRKLFGKFVHQGMSDRTCEIRDMETCLKTMDDCRIAVSALGLLRYLNTLSEVSEDYNTKFMERSNARAKEPEAGITIPSKEEVISELRFLLQSIDVTAATHPENDYSKLIEIINYDLTKARAQLRNLASRRKTAKAKAEKKNAQNTFESDNN
jgi:Family of unknown function (DUF6261)